MTKRIGFHFFWLFFLSIAFYIALSISWVALSSVNFAYPLLHDYAGLGKNIEEFGPKNRVKRYFHQTDRGERLRLFEGIVMGIQNSGEGLEQLEYHSHGGRKYKLLTKAELIHLKDVAELYNHFKRALYYALGIAIFLLVFRHCRTISLPSRSQLVRYALIPPILGVVIYLIGAETVFYQLHILLFPDGHQWFFYYEESLMSMMMKAPDMFAYIAVMLGVLALFVTVLLVGAYRYSLRYWQLQ